MFRSLRIRNFKIYFSGQMVSMAGTFMQAVAQSWLVLKITGSGTALGVVTVLQFLPMTVLAPMAGVIVDRRDRRRLMLFCELLLGAEALLMGLLVTTGHAELWIVYLLAFVLGVISSLEQPTRSAFVYDLVGPGDLSNAVSLNMALNNVSRASGPALAGLLIAAVGIAPCFYINAVSFLAVVVALLLMRPSEFFHMPPQPRKPRQFREGLIYVWRTPALLAVLFLACIYCGLVWEFEVSLPLMAKTTFHGTAALFGLMIGAVGTGAIFGALFTARRAIVSIRLVVGAAMVSSVLVLAAAVAPNPPVALALLVLVGIAGTTFASSASSYVQLEAAPGMRGRVVGLWAVAALGMRPVGGPIVGWIGQHIGPRQSLAFGPIVLLFIGVPVWWLIARSGERVVTEPEPAPELVSALEAT
jgi:MFS family permease